MIIDLDSQLRESEYMDDVFNLKGTPYDKYTPVAMDENAGPGRRRFRHSWEHATPGVAPRTTTATCTTRRRTGAVVKRGAWGGAPAQLDA
jgi:hypothetical protein